jgi:RNA-directed DNA polymerase
MSEAKPFEISKQVVWEAYQRVKANKGAAGVDNESMEEFERELKNNLYKIWNRMSSGTYFPPPVKTVIIPKKDGGERKLGVPTISDRIAQMVVKMYLEPVVEPHFHPDSYGYRPKKSAIEAVGAARKRCWRLDWVVDLDIKGFLDHASRSSLPILTRVSLPSRSWRKISTVSARSGNRYIFVAGSRSTSSTPRRMR